MKTTWKCPFYDYVLGKRKLKFNPNLRVDKNENRVLFTSELENVLASHQPHVYHHPAAYVNLDVISLALAVISVGRTEFAYHL